MERWDVKTTLEIPDNVFKNVKAKAALEGRKLKDVVAAALAEYLRNPGKLQAQPKRCPFPLFRGQGGPLLKTISNQKIAELEAQEEHARYQRSFGR